MVLECEKSLNLKAPFENPSPSPRDTFLLSLSSAIFPSNAHSFIRMRVKPSSASSVPLLSHSNWSDVFSYKNQNSIAIHTQGLSLHNHSFAPIVITIICRTVDSTSSINGMCVFSSATEEHFNGHIKFSLMRKT